MSAGKVKRTGQGKTANSAALEDFFRTRPGSLGLFKALRKIIRRVCSPRMEVSRSQISFGETYKYLWVWLPQTWVNNRPENSITLTILTGRRIRSPRITESLQPKKGFWTQHIVIDSVADIDGEIEDLIRASYTFYLTRLSRLKPAKNR